MEYVEANSTFCHVCGTRISLQEPTARKRAARTRTVTRRTGPRRKKLACVHCDYPLQIPEASDSWQCPMCSGYLDLKDHELNTSAGRSILTYGDITIKARGRFGGTRIEGKNIFVQGGGAAGQITAREKLVVSRPSKLDGDITAEQVIVEAEGGFENRRTLRCRTAEIRGRVRLREMTVSDSLKIFAGARLQVDLIRSPDIEVEEGGRLIAEQAVIRMPESKADGTVLSPPPAEEEAVVDRDVA